MSRGRVKSDGQNGFAVSLLAELVRALEAYSRHTAGCYSNCSPSVCVHVVWYGVGFHGKAETCPCAGSEVIQHVRGESYN